MFAHFSVDNIDILEDTLDGKNTFHATQMAVWQRGPPHVNEAEMHQIGKEKVLKHPALNKLSKIESIVMPKTKPQPHFKNVKPQYESIIEFNNNHDSLTTTDLAWLVSRTEGDGAQHVPGWSGFNKMISSVCPEITTAGLLPIIQQPAHEYDTLNTVIIRCMDISKALGQKHTVITADQALYCKLKELVWFKAEEYHDVIIRLGGLHIMMNFIQCIGKHMECSGLEDIWTEADLFGENTIHTIMSGKAYNRAVRAHKLTYEALWRVFWLQLKQWLHDRGDQVSESLTKSANDVIMAFDNGHKDMISEKVEMLSEELNRYPEIREFEEENNSNPTFVFWRAYMKMINILLDFLRAERDGNWNLHVSSFARMLPFLFVYDHTNYARWGPVYLLDMATLNESAHEIFSEFVAGNFPVKRSADVFNQVSADQALEWLNRSCKVAGGLIGITRNETAREKWCLTFNEKTYVSECTKSLFGIDHNDLVPTRSDSLPSGISRDEDDVRKLVYQFERFKVFDPSTILRCITTNDVVPDEIKDTLLQTEEHGQMLLKQFVDERFNKKSLPLSATIPRNKARTFRSLTEVTVERNNEKKVVKADRHLFQRLLVATDAGRYINLTEILKHELSSVPLALADISGNLRPTVKSHLSDVLQENIDIRVSLPKDDTVSCLLIDGPALIQAIGKPTGSKTFGDLADVFCDCIFNKFELGYTRVDVLFDRYNDYSIKNATRSKRVGKNRRPIRKVVDSPDVPLPQIWKNFISVPQNKADLANFLTSELMKRIEDVPDNCELVTGGGFRDLTDVMSSRQRDLSFLKANHEEADTRLVLHAFDANVQGIKRTVVECADTDVLVLLLHYTDVVSDEVWFKKGKKFIPIHDIELDPEVRRNIISFHALTGCDTTSGFMGIGKKSAWKIFTKFPQLLTSVSADNITEETKADIETFVCKMYGCDISSVNLARKLLFVRAKKAPGALPPTEDAFHFHIKRVQYQVNIWTQATNTTQNIPDPVESMGWSQDLSNRCLVPTLMSLEPVPAACLELVTCACKTKCSSGKCKCYKRKLMCTGACGCEAVDCHNPTG